MGEHEIFLYAFLGFVALRVVIERTLAVLNARYVAALRGQIPESLKDVITPETYERSIDYALARTRFGHVSALFDVGITLLFIYSPILAGFNVVLRMLERPELTHGVLLILWFTVAHSLMHLPLGIYGTFFLEAKFGFNKTTWGTFWLDKIKGIGLALVIGAPFLYALLFIVNSGWPLWWLWSALFIIGFQFLMMILFPLVIAPLFNKFTPLQDGELKTSLETLAKKCDFSTNGIFVVDGSKRSAHSNAYFTGIGKARRIVLFDTLIQQLSVSELAAVLAHEIGHYKRKHIVKMLVLSSGLTVAGVWIMSQMIEWRPMFQAFSIAMDDTAMGLILFTIVIGDFTFWVGPLFHKLSRQHEYEADAYAREAVSDYRPLEGALLKLFEKNLATLTPHPAFSTWHYSHPTLLERLKALKNG